MNDRTQQPSQAPGARQVQRRRREWGRTHPRQPTPTPTPTAQRERGLLHAPRAGGVIAYRRRESRHDLSMLAMPPAPECESRLRWCSRGPRPQATVLESRADHRRRAPRRPLFGGENTSRKTRRPEARTSEEDVSTSRVPEVAHRCRPCKS